MVRACRVHFELEIRFAPQMHAILRFPSFQKCFEHGETCFAQFLISELSKVLQACCLLHTVTWRHASRDNGVQFTHIRASKYAPNIAQCASRHNGVQFLFFIRQDGSAPAALASLLFDPPDPQIIGKTQCFATFLTFSRACIFFVFLSSTLVSSSLLSNFSHLCVSSFHIVRNLSSKLPWINKCLNPIYMNNISISGLNWL